MLHLDNTLRSQLKTRAENNARGKKKPIQYNILHLSYGETTEHTWNTSMLHITTAHKNVKVHRGVLQMGILVILISELA